MTTPLTTAELLHKAVTAEKIHGVGSRQATEAWKAYGEAIDMSELEDDG